MKVGPNDVAAGDEIAAANIDDLTYTPDPLFVGEDAFGWNGSNGVDYACTDAVVNITIFVDCNGNNVSDSEDIANGTSLDCNSNSVPDECDILDGTSEDCNTNGVLDECDIAGQTSNDVNGSGVPDECEPDCNLNNVPDDWDISQSTRYYVTCYIC